jgi:hypothetical protein
MLQQLEHTMRLEHPVVCSMCARLSCKDYKSRCVCVRARACHTHVYTQGDGAHSN